MNEKYNIFQKNYFKVNEKTYLPNSIKQERTNVKEALMFINKIISGADPEHQDLVFAVNMHNTKIDFLVVGDYEANVYLSREMAEKENIEIKRFGKNRYLHLREDIEEHSPFYNQMELSNLVYTLFKPKTNNKGRIITTTILEPNHEKTIEEAKRTRDYYNQLRGQIINLPKC